MLDSLDTDFHKSLNDLGKELLDKLEKSELENSGFTSFAKRLVLTKPTFEQYDTITASKVVGGLKNTIEEYMNSKFKIELSKYPSFKFELCYSINRVSKKTNFDFYLLKSNATII